MNKKEQLLHLANSIKTSEGDCFNFNETELVKELNLQQENKSSLVIKILSIFGGILSSFAFLGFLLIAGLYDSEIGMVIFGIGFIAGSILINKAQDKLITDTLSVSLYILGLALIGFGFSEMDMNENLIIIVFIGIAVSSLFITQNYMLSFISILTINGSLLALIASNNLYSLIHLYIAINTALLVFIFLNEAKIITYNKKFSKLYNPSRIAIVISLLTGLIVVGTKDFLPISTNIIWISSLVFFVAIIYLISKIVSVLQIETAKNKNLIYLLSGIILIPTVLSPSISGALLIVLLSFYVNYKTGLVIGIISFIYFISQYYYDLSFTLLTKSIILFSSGILFITFYLIINKKLLPNEKN
ncbi:MAG: DUF4401 domain-containing protein [Flavobacteriaceae bacterium]|nr:DUF4401 domain-containing protein [Flavobacteriaceae bacterium]